MAGYPPPGQDWRALEQDRRAQRRLLREQAKLQQLQAQALRPSSILGPVLLIAIGVVALLVELGHLRMPYVLDLLGRWWPLLLVGAGCVRLAEWTSDRSRRREAVALGQPYLPRSISGGVVLLLLALIAAGVLNRLSHGTLPHALGHDFALNEDNWSEFLGDKHESDATLLEACPDGTTLTIDLSHGDITVSGTSNDGQMHLAAHTTVFTRNDAEAVKQAGKLTPVMRHVGTQLMVAVPAVEGARVDLTITVPATIPVVAHANQGDVSVRAQHATVSIIANHGDVEANDISGPINVHINHGDSSFSGHNDQGGVTVEGRSMDLTLSDTTGLVALNGEFFGTIHLERSNGPLQLHTSRIDLQVGRVVGNLELSETADLTADGILGPVVLNTRNRNITMERVSGEVTITNRNGSVTLSAAPPLRSISIENQTGEVEVTLPANSGFILDASTHDGDLTNEFGLTSTEEHDGNRLQGTISGGGPAIHLATTQADLSIQRADIAPLAPAAPLPSAPSLHESTPAQHPRHRTGETPHTEVTFWREKNGSSCREDSATYPDTWTTNVEGPTFLGWGLSILCRRLPNLPHTYACSTIGPARLNFRVRDGNGCDPRGRLTGKPMTPRSHGAT